MSSPTDDRTSSGVDLTEFTSLGKVSWETRARRIHQRFPSVDDFNWAVALDRDINLFARIVRDILKLEQAVPGRPGPRPSLDKNAAIRRLHQLWGDDFTILAFPEALRILTDNRSIRYVAGVTGLQKDHVHRLLRGDVQPDGYALRQCAKAFGKHPSYFLEWRILYITQALTARLEWSPETSIDLFQALDRQRKAAV